MSELRVHQPRRVGAFLSGPRSCLVPHMPTRDSSFTFSLPQCSENPRIDPAVFGEAEKVESAQIGLNRSYFLLIVGQFLRDCNRHSSTIQEVSAPGWNSWRAAVTLLPARTGNGERAGCGEGFERMPLFGPIEINCNGIHPRRKVGGIPQA